MIKNSFVSESELIYNINGDCMRRGSILLNMLDEDLELLANDPDAFFNGIDTIAPKAVSILNIGESIVIPEGITSIGEYAFGYSGSLKKVTINASKPKVFASVFSSCSKLEEVTINSDLLSLPPRTFSLSRALKKVTLNPSIKIIGIEAFSNCSSLEEIDNISGLEIISAGAFKHCTSLRIVILPDSLSCIDLDAFYGCSELEYFSFPYPLTNFSNLFYQFRYEYIYVNKNLNRVILTRKRDDSLNDEYCCFNFKNHSHQEDLLLDPNYIKNLVVTQMLRGSNLIPFVPKDYALSTFPSSRIMEFYYNHNFKRWGKITEIVSPDIYLDDDERYRYMPALLKFYYVLGGFSSNQGESERAFEYLTDLLGKDIVDIHFLYQVYTQFNSLNISRGYDKEYATFLMKYYKDNPYFLRFAFDEYQPEIDYVATAYNLFEQVKSRYPHKMINTNTKYDILTPRMVADVCNAKIYNGVDEGNEELAKLISGYGYSQSEFDIIQDIYNQVKIKYGKWSKIHPMLYLDNPKAGDSRVTSRLLSKQSHLGFVLGNITNCCQTVSMTGKECVSEGYLSPYCGFVVFESEVEEVGGKKAIIGQSFVWYDPSTKTVCFDNIELPKAVMEQLCKKNISDIKANIKDLMRCIEDTSRRFVASMKKRGIEVDYVTMGAGNNELDIELDSRYECIVLPKAMAPEYDGYSDAWEGQYTIYKAPSKAEISRREELMRDCKMRGRKKRK